MITFCRSGYFIHNTNFNSGFFEDLTDLISQLTIYIGYSSVLLLIIYGYRTVYNG